MRDKATGASGGMPAPPHGRDDNEPSRLVGLFTIILTLAGWTVVPLLIKEFEKDVDAWTSNGWRYGFAALIWAPLLMWHAFRRSWPPGLMRAAFVPGLINACAQVAFTLSFYKIDPGLVTFGLRVQIVVVTIAAAVLFPAERRMIRSPWFLIGLVLVVGGTLATAGQSPAFGTQTGLFGIALAMLAGAGYALYAISVRWCMKGYSSISSFAAISQYTAVAMIVLMLFFGEDAGARALDMTASRFGLFVLSAVIGIALGHVLYYLSIARLGVAVSTGIVQLQPFTVGVLSMVVFGEVLSAGQWFSGGIAVSGAVLMVTVQHVMQQRDRARKRLERVAPALDPLSEPMPEPMLEPAAEIAEGPRAERASADVAILEEQHREAQAGPDVK
ncbi:MAG: DMT family transporter [Planctomycetota bacterium]